MTATRARFFLTATLLPLLALACGGADDTDVPAADADASMGGAMSEGNPMIDLLEDDQVVFGIFSGEQSAEGGRMMAAGPDVDFVFYSLESGPFDLDAMAAYMDGLAQASEGAPAPIALRIPPIRDDRQAAVERTRQGLATGAQAIVYPHVESVEDVALTVEAIGDRLWPAHPDGDVLSVLLIEDQVGIERASEIVGAAGVGVVIPGPGDLRRAYEGDMEAVEGAIQAVLSACLELDVPCGITAGVDDIATRIEQGFRFFIVTEPEAVAVGRVAAGRSE